MELLAEVIQETLDRPKTKEELQKLHFFYDFIILSVTKLIIKSEMLGDEYRKELFRKTVDHLAQIQSIPSDQIENPELKALFDEYVHKLKQLRGKLRGSLEHDIVNGISHCAKANIDEILSK